MEDPVSFDRKFFQDINEITSIGAGSLGGKAQGLVETAEWIRAKNDQAHSKGISLDIPCMTVIATDFFDEFMKSNHLYEAALSDLPDDRIAHAFQKGELPPRLLGDLRALADQVHTPLAIRSSSLLEDAMCSPFAGVYGTKMIPNNQPDPDTRFRALVAAIKYVYASTFFIDAKRYVASTRRSFDEEKMAVIIQEVVGQRVGDRFYPAISGVARSYNFYPCGPSRPEDGVVNLALGLGKTIVDGGLTWTFSPTAPQAPPPFNDVDGLLNNTQTKFWSVNMGRPPAYDPIRESEYLVQAELAEADYDNMLRLTASTYDPGSDRIVPGVGPRGPRIITFAPILVYNEVPLNDLIGAVLSECEDKTNSEVEIEFAVNLDRKMGVPARFGLLQVRPMVVSSERIELAPERLESSSVVIATENALGNGTIDHIVDIVYVRPDIFEPKFSRLVATDLERVNHALVQERRPYVLIGFGRWGSADPWLGIPVVWSQLSGAKVIVEATLPNMRPDPSQGSHFFHNMTSFRISYFSVPHSGKYKIDWAWIEQEPEVSASRFVRHVRTHSPLSIAVDGRCGRGVIFRHE
jgi:hypothetical protein